MAFLDLGVGIPDDNDLVVGPGRAMPDVGAPSLMDGGTIFDSER